MNDYTATRHSLHAVAERLLAGPQYREADTIRLTTVSGGFATTVAPAVTVDGNRLRVGDGTSHRLHDRTIVELATLTGIVAGAPQGVYRDTADWDDETPLIVDSVAAQMISEAFGHGDAALRTLPGAPEPVLWPEHFDLAISLEEANYGVSPGDSTIPEPYAYVGPWVRPTGVFWDQPFGAARPLSELDGAKAIATFFAEGRRRAAL
ncbi:hypothetical protein [Nocardia salmonicida]|uniref:hypothetical protein n=1 Tax=Nocardia salmonicida TaxID=53431 RepID=UPI0037B1F20A